MKNKVINLILTYIVDFIFILILLVLAAVFFNAPVVKYYYIVFFVVLIISLLPIAGYFYNIIDTIISPISYEKVFAQTVDSILNIESFDEMLKATFDQILQLMNVKTGYLIFYYHERYEFNIFYQKNKRSRVIRNARIENDNILFKVINGPDDIIIKNMLNPSINFEKSILDELKKFNAEIVVPIYYHEMFLGLIVIGDRKRKFSERELRLLQVFASKTAILSVNSFFFSELLKKKEIEKECELASDIQKKFLPKTEIQEGRIKIRIYHETSSLMIREFYDVFKNDREKDDIRVSAYRLHGDITGTSIYMPGIQALLQSFTRMGFPPSGCISRLKKTMGNHIMDEEISMFYSTIKQNGEVSYVNNNYQPPLIYNHEENILYPVQGNKRKTATNIRLNSGDILIISCESIFNILNEKAPDFLEILKNDSTSLRKLRTKLIRKLKEYRQQNEKDELLILISPGEAS